MAVDEKRSEVAKMTPRWRRVRDCIAGEDDVKEHDRNSTRGRYLPKLSGHSSEEYLAYLERALFYNATSRTLDGMTGLVFRTDPYVEVPTGIDPMVENIDMRGTHIFEVVRNVFREIMTTGRVGLLVDFPSTDGMQEMTIDAYEGMGLRPYIHQYQAEQITTWKVENVAGADILTMVVLHENVEIHGDDRFSVGSKDRYRVLELVEGEYWQTVYEKGSDGFIPIGDPVRPLVNGEPWNEIPFVFVGVHTLSPDIEDPPLLDMANVNISHYRTQADLENGAHWTGVPTPVITGLPEDTVEIEVGSTSGIVLPEGGDAKFLEFSGQGLKALEERAKVKEEMMARIGARMLSGEKKAAESAEAESIRRAGENSVLAEIANRVSTGVVRALSLFARWAGADGDIEVRLNTDYDPVDMDPQMLTAIVKSWQSGAIAHEDLFYALKRGDLIREDREFRDMLNDIQTQVPEAF